MTLEGVPEPKAVRVNDRSKVHLTDQAAGKITFCGQTGTLTPVAMSMEEIDELPAAEKCLRCASVTQSRARARRIANG